MHRHSSFEAKIRVAFTAAVLVVAGLTVVTWKLANDATQAAGWVAHSHEVLRVLARASADTLQIELSTQNYRISGDPARPAEPDASIVAREETLRHLHQLISDTPQQQENWQQLRAVIDERLAITRKAGLLRKTQGFAAASAYIATAPLQETRERMHQLLHAMDEKEQRLLEVRNTEQLHARQTMLAAGALVALLLVGLLSATYVLIRRQLRDAQASRQALSESEKSLSTTLNSIGDAVLATDTLGRVTRMNPVAQQLTGWSLEQAQGRPIEEVLCLIHEHTRAPAAVPVAKALATGEVQQLANHTALIARDGREYLIADSAAPIRDDAGRLKGVVLVFRDVTTERKTKRTIREQNEQLEQRVRERTMQLLESEDHLRSIINYVPVMIAYIDTDQRYVYANHHYQTYFTSGKTNITGRTVQEILGEKNYAIASPFIHRALQGIPKNYDWQPFPGIWHSVNYVPKRGAQGRVVGYFVLAYDISERKNSEGKIQALNTDLAQHVRELEHVSRALKTLSACNRAMLRATGEQDLLDTMCRAIVTTGNYLMASVWYRVDDDYQSLPPMAECNHPGGLDNLRQMHGSWGDNAYGQGAVATAIRTNQTSVVRNILTDPAYERWRSYLPGCACGVACPLRVDDEIIGGIIIYAAEPDSFGLDEVALLTESADDLAFGIETLRARIEQKKSQVALHRLGRYDALTGLPNEVQFTEALTAAIDTSVRLKRPSTALQVNVQRLNDINLALGFRQGDQILREFGTRLVNAAPKTAIVARLRGDEFAILLPDHDLHAAIATVQRLEEQLAVPFPIASIALDMSARTGIVVLPDHGTTAHDLMRRMDIALHQAKKRGLKYAVFDPAQSQDQSQRLALAGELRQAIEAGDLRLYLQPKVEMATGRVCGAEGLVRWQHAERGLIPPGAFIELAERTGLIHQLTTWVIEAALRLNQTWARQGCALPIAVNLSAHNLRDPDLRERIHHLQTHLGVAPGLLEMEITESMVMDDPESALRALRDLRDDGIALYIDDFGTGYSSLTYLQKLPVNYIKIDQSFVFDMLTNKESLLIVRATIELSHDLGYKVVAEGVETQAHWDQLAALGCDIAQGYFIARPMPAEAFPSWTAQFTPPATHKVS